MSKRRTTDGKFVPPRSGRAILGIWVAAVLSLGLLYLAGQAVLSDMLSFRACNSHASGLAVSSCGKQGVNLGDLVLLGLFVLAAVLVLSLWTAALRTVRRRK